jgi:hypothetical protein
MVLGFIGGNGGSHPAKVIKTRTAAASARNGFLVVTAIFGLVFCWTQT